MRQELRVGGTEKLTCNENHTNIQYLECHQGNAVYALASYIPGKSHSNREVHHVTLNNQDLFPITHNNTHVYSSYVLWPNV